MADKFLHEKELRQYCRELNREMRQADKDYEKFEYGNKPDPKRAAAAMKRMNQLGKQMDRIEDITYFELS